MYTHVHTYTHAHIDVRIFKYMESSYLSCSETYSFNFNLMFWNFSHDDT